MSTDLLLHSLKQVLSDRQFLKNKQEQLRAARNHNTMQHSVRPQDIRIITDDEETELLGEISILPASEDDTLDIEIVDDADSLDIIIEDVSPSPNDDKEELIVIDDAIDVNIEPSSNIINILTPNVFDEDWAVGRIREIKEQIQQNATKIQSIKAEKSKAAETYSNNRLALEQKYKDLLGRHDTTINGEKQQHDSRLNRIDGQINRENTRLQSDQQRFWYHLLTRLGLVHPDTSELERQRKKRQQELASHQDILKALRDNRYQLGNELSQKRVTLDQRYRAYLQGLTDQINAIYQLTIHQLIPEGERVLDDWLQYLATELSRVYALWNEQNLQALNVEALIEQKTTRSPGLDVGILLYDDPIAEIPAVIDPISNRRHVFIQGADSNTRAMQMRAILLRLLLAFPVGLARLLLLDGIELGRTLAIFAAKLHDDICGGRVYDREQEIANELGKIRARIAQITQHVLVEHDNINSYNQANPEIPEPYRFVIVNEFPCGFSAQALRQFQDIVRNGPRAGVYILATVSDAMPDSHGFDLNDFIAGAYHLSLDGTGALQWNSEYLSEYQVRSAAPPDERVISHTLSVVSQAYEQKPTVLPYERVKRDLPPLWSVSTDTGLRSPIGLTFGGKLHAFEFNDEFVHGLIGGRTGSGKTVLLHDLICGLAQLHSPEDLHLYLLDFKGTEFNVYARHNLPHARVVAVDCDVEVGLSIIKALLNEMERRRRLFDDVAVTGIQSYRQKGKKLPRILLIIDEVQMLTQASDTRLVREVEASLIDLLKRGRAPGIHVLLGTQSPSSVLSNQMLQQIAIRTCLLADQQVSRLVLGESNEAASGLQKQGEAVYNAYNGRPDKNVFIRTALLEREECVKIVEHLGEKADSIGYEAPGDRLYFDGTSRMALAEASTLKQALRLQTDPPLSNQVEVPLGNPIEIKEDTAVQFVRRRYSHLVIVGGKGESRHALLRNVVLGLCIQQSYDAAIFYVIDLSFEGEPYADLMRTFQRMPHEFQFARNSRLGETLLEEIYEEFSEREEQAKQGRTVEQKIFLVIFGMENFSSLRGEDRFSQPEARKNFEKILADGAGLGIHAIVATQTLGKGAILKADPFELRVCFQIAEDDSRALLDSDAGSKLLRPDRAIFRRRDWPYGKVEKFKPYLPTTRADIENIADILVRRAANQREGR
jgi:hypothetical protein